jgi:excisionase family DNA binding protein
MSTSQPNKVAYRPEKAADTFGLSRSYVYLLLQRGELQARKCGNITLIEHDEMVRWLRSLPTFKPTAASVEAHL